jgi:hypothetical protein
LKNRVEATEALERKLGRYESLLGEKLEGLHEQLTNVRAQLCVAQVQAEQEGDAARAAS